MSDSSGSSCSGALPEEEGLLGAMEIESLQGHDMWIVGKGAIASYRGRRLESRRGLSTTVEEYN